jgi:hypothetical protein
MEDQTPEQIAAAAAAAEAARKSRIAMALKDSSFVSGLGITNGTQLEEIERRAAVALGL